MSIAIVPAAGEGRRFAEAGGGSANKLAAAIGDEPMLTRTIRSLLDGGVDRVVIVTSPAGLGALEPPDDVRVLIVVNPDPSRGMLSTIQTGLADAAGDPILVLPGDMPFVLPGTVAAVAAACARSGQVVVPRYAGRRGHPVAMPGTLRAAILASDQASNLADVLRLSGTGRIELDVEDAGVVRDVDVPADLQPRANF